MSSSNNGTSVGDNGTDPITSSSATTPEPGSEGHSTAVETLGERELYDPPPFTTAMTRVHWLPLPLIEEIPVPQKIMTELELIMTAWSEEQAKYFFVVSWLIRALIFAGWSFIAYYWYRVVILSERRLRGTANMPSGVKIGNVVYFDFDCNGLPAGRMVIGLLNEDCPLYCEYFHRRCTGNGGNGDSFRGVKLMSMVPTHAAIFGDGSEMTHEVAGFNPRWLPTEKESQGAWRGALSSLAYDREKQSPNFMVHVSAGDYTPQIFGMILSGYEVIEKMNKSGIKHGSAPKSEYVISGCGELCTLNKAYIVPLPWRLFESVSNGFDTEKYGEPADPSLLDPPREDAKKYFKQYPLETKPFGASDPTKASQKSAWFGANTDLQ